MTKIRHYEFILIISSLEKGRISQTVINHDRTDSKFSNVTEKSPYNVMHGDFRSISEMDYFPPTSQTSPHDRSAGI